MLKSINRKNMKNLIDYFMNVRGFSHSNDILTNNKTRSFSTIEKKETEEIEEVIESINPYDDRED